MPSSDRSATNRRASSSIIARSTAGLPSSPNFGSEVVRKQRQHAGEGRGDVGPGRGVQAPARRPAPPRRSPVRSIAGSAGRDGSRRTRPAGSMSWKTTTIENRMIPRSDQSDHAEDDARRRSASQKTLRAEAGQRHDHVADDQPGIARGILDRVARLVGGDADRRQRPPGVDSGESRRTLLLGS